MIKKFNIHRGFTLIELLVVISIIGVLTGLSIFGLLGARTAARDADRRSDLEQLRSGLEIYKADCNVYPGTLNLGSATTLRGNGSTTSCLNNNVYITTTPIDPNSPTRRYSYTSGGAGTIYYLCAALEQPPIPAMDVSRCGGCGQTCNYIVTNP